MNQLSTYKSISPTSIVSSPITWLRQAYSREPLLTVFGLFWWACLVPLALAYGLDERSLRGVNIWLKPIKFALSLGLFSLCTAWFIGMLKPQRQQSKAIAYVIWGIILAGTFENVYITLQAALGQASHFNVGDAFHGLMFTLMGVGALVLTSTQAVLAVQLHRHGQIQIPSNFRLAVVMGLAMTFLLGTIAGAALSGLQPASGQGMLLFGWHLGGGDLRPAHFLGIHAQQLFPLVAWACMGMKLNFSKTHIAVFTALYTSVWLVLFVMGLSK